MGVIETALTLGASQLDAVRKLYDILLVDDTYLCPDPFSLSAPPPESHTRAPCANDGCLFSTSLTPFPPPAALVFAFEEPAKPFWSLARWKKKPAVPAVPGGLTLADIEGKFDPWRLSSMGEYEDIWGEVDEGWPTNSWWTEKGSWHLAVDGKGGETCWESWRRTSDSTSPFAASPLTLFFYSAGRAGPLWAHAGHAESDQGDQARRITRPGARGRVGEHGRRRRGVGAAHGPRRRRWRLGASTSLPSPLRDKSNL